MNELLEQGIIFFNSGRYFEAHERWEDLWRGSAGPLRLYYQGLVQAAVGLHHLGRRNTEGARSLLVRSLEKLEQYPEAFEGIQNGELVHDLRAVLNKLEPFPLRIARLQ